VFILFKHNGNAAVARSLESRLCKLRTSREDEVRTEVESFYERLPKVKGSRFTQNPTPAFCSHQENC
jgi:hypothetical protein